MNIEVLTNEAENELIKLGLKIKTIKFKDVSHYEDCTFFKFYISTGEYNGEFSYTRSSGKINSLTIHEISAIK